MKTYLIDTNIVIEYLRGNIEAKRFLEDTSTTMFLSYITVGELIQGVRNKKELKVLKNVIKLFGIDYGSKKILQKALKILEEINLKNGLGLLDSIIATTAIENNSVLITTNTKHFKEIKNLVVLNPLATPK